MQIVCPNCSTTYKIDTSSVGPSGRSVRCVRCRTVWFAANTDALSDIAEAHRAEMTQFAVAGVDGSAPPEDQPPGSQAPDMAAWSEASHDADRTADADRAAAPDGLITIRDAPALVPTEPGDAAQAALEPVDIESAALQRALRAERGRFRLPMPGWSALIVALIVGNIALVGWRSDVVRVAPQTAPLYAALGLPVNVRGLDFTDVKSETEVHDGVRVLLVSGTIKSVAPHAVEVPRLRFAIRNEVGNEIYTWTALPGRSVLQAGETLAFQSRLASPPPETKDVLVRFFNRRDRSAGIE
jgi:predicted Zn finger-like uncharacterized protein